MGKRLDVTGQRYGALVAIRPSELRHRNSVNWLFKCDCGNEVIYPINSVRAGREKSCGCRINKKAPKPRESTLKPGDQFGDLTVVKIVGKHTDGHFMSEVKCKCGEVFAIRDSLIRCGRITRCKKCSSEALKTHGMTDTPLFHCWQSMRSRCYNPNNKEYKHYGARGISVCPEWKDSRTFIEWALNNGYKEGLTIDRIDVNGNYEPSNCRWTTMLRQARNKRNTRYIHFEGRYLPIRDVAEITGIKAATIIQRLDKRGWDEYSAAHLPPNSKTAYNPTMRQTIITEINSGKTIIFQNTAEASRFLGKVDSFIIGRVSRCGPKFTYNDYLIEVKESEKVLSEKQTYNSLLNIS